MKSFSMSVLLAALVALACAGAVDAGERTNRALIVAVSSYPNLPTKYVLKGPPNDARLVRDTLQTLEGAARFDPQNIVVLADAVNGAREPTLAAITEALHEIATESREGDFVYIHFSGHGSQQPAGNPASEVDGLDEVFLPLDVGMPKSDTKLFPNGLVDDTIGKNLDAIRASGAFVWVTFDSCQSTTSTRAAADGPEVARWVNPLEVGFDVSDFPNTKRGPQSELDQEVMLSDEELDAGRPSDYAGLVAFYAAQTIEITPDLPRPDATGDWYGLFTYTLFSRIAARPNATFRQLGQGIISEYAAQNRVLPTPQFEGDLDLPLFLNETATVPRQWMLTATAGELRVPAGLLHQLSKGAKLAILAHPEDKPEDAIGYAEVRSVAELSSSLRTIIYQGKQRLAPTAIPSGAFARLIENGIDFALRVSVASVDPQYAAQTASLRASVDRIAADPNLPMNLVVVNNGQDAALRLYVADENEIASLSSGTVAASAASEPLIWFLPASGEVPADRDRWPNAIRLPATESAMDDAMRSTLLGIFRALGLARLSGLGEAQQSVEVAMSVSRADKSEFSMERATPTSLFPGDVVHITASNNGKEPVDVNVLYVDRTYEITHWLATRLHKGNRLDKNLFQQSNKVFGDEKLFVVVTRAGRLVEIEDLSFLVQRGIRDPAYRSPPNGSEFEDALYALLGSPPTRSQIYKPQQNQRGAIFIYPVVARRSP